MLLINCKVELSLSWDPNCVLSNFVGASTFTITDAKLYVPIVTLSIEDNSKLSKLLSEGFKRSAYWNKYQVIPNKMVNIAINYLIQMIKELRDCLFLLTIIQQVVMVKFLLILSKNIFFQELK